MSTPCHKLALLALLLSLTPRECLAGPHKIPRHPSYAGWEAWNSTDNNATTTTTTTEVHSTTRSTTTLCTTETADSARAWGDWTGYGPGTHSGGSSGSPNDAEWSVTGSNGHSGQPSTSNWTPNGSSNGPDWNDPVSGSSGGSSDGSSDGWSGGSKGGSPGDTGGHSDGSGPSHSGGAYQGGGWSGTGPNGWQNSTNSGGQNSTNDDWNPDEGVPPLSAEAIAFITSEEALAIAGFPDNDTDQPSRFVKRQSGPGNFSGEITQEQWIENDMDNWLIGYVQRVPIPRRPGTRLMDSARFFHDFWLSTGEENLVLCESLYESCNVSPIDDSKRYPYISKDDALRAAFVRQVMKVWQSGNRQAFQIINQAVSNSQINIQTAHRVFLQSDPPKATSIFDIILPALAAVTVFAPTLAPAVSLLSNIYTATNSLSKREEDDAADIFRRRYPRASTHEKRASDNVIADILDRVSALETQPVKSWVDDVNKGVEKSAKLVDQAAKAVIAMKGLNPGVAPSTISSWDFFDARVFSDLESYPLTHLVAFEKNILYWAATEYQGTNGPVAVAGMKSILLGGEWAKINANKDPDSVTIPKVKAFFNAMVFMQVIQNQAIYFWTQRVPSSSDCESAAKSAKSKGWLAKDGWYQCADMGGGYEFRMARRPMLNEGQAQVVNDLTWNPFGDILRVTMFPGSSDTCFVQKKTWFEQNSAGLNNFKDDLLKAAGYSFNIGDVYAASVACQNALGDPFADDQPRQGNFYHPMQTKATADQILTGGLPMCLFNLPVFRVGDAGKNNWCKYALGGMKGAAGGLRSYYRPDLDTCDYDIVYWALQSDNKICLTDQRNYRASNWVARPGCERYDRGIHLVGYRRA